MAPTLDQRVKEARQEHLLLFSRLVELQIVPDLEDGSTDPFSGFQDAGETIHLEPKLLLDETWGWHFGMEYPLEQNSNAQLTVGDTLFVDTYDPNQPPTSFLFLYVAHLMVSPRTLRTTTRKRYCALVYRLFDAGEPVFDPTNKSMISKIVEHNPASSHMQTRLYPSNQYFWVDAAALLTYGRQIFVEGLSPLRDDIEKVEYLATHLWLYPTANGDWRPPNDNYGVAARFCPIRRRDGSRNFPFKLAGFHDRDDVTPSPLLIEETWEQIASLYDFTDIGRERALIRSDAREALKRDRERRKSRLIESKAGHSQPTSEPVTPAADKLRMKDRMQKRRRESSQDLREGMNAGASRPALKKAKTTISDAAVSAESGESKETKSIQQPCAVSTNSPQCAQTNDVRNVPEDASPSEKKATVPVKAGAKPCQPMDTSPVDQQAAKISSRVTCKAKATTEKPEPTRKSLADNLQAQAVRGDGAPVESQSMETEVASKKREEATRAATDMIKQTTQREEKLREEIHTLLRKVDDEARSASQTSEEVAQVRRRREEALRAELEVDWERRKGALRMEMEREHKQRENALRVELNEEGKEREDRLRAEIQCLSAKFEDATRNSEAMVQEHEHREKALRVELERREEAICIRMAKEQKQRENALRIELSATHDTEKAKLRAQLESALRREADKCAELASEREEMTGMRHRIEILEEENGILVAERELGERKARLAVLREKAAV